MAALAGIREKLAREVIQGPPGVYLWGGETTVTLPSHPGRGGRNQTVALAAAQIINGYNNIHFLSVGTDGTDGPTEEAGGLVDGSTIRQGQSRGFDVEQSLANADAGSFLTVCGDLIKTGPTGTNVMDIIIGLKI